MTLVCIALAIEYIVRGGLTSRYIPKITMSPLIIKHHLRLRLNIIPWDQWNKKLDQKQTYAIYLPTVRPRPPATLEYSHPSVRQANQPTNQRRDVITIQCDDEAVYGIASHRFAIYLSHYLSCFSGSSFSKLFI